MSTAPGSAPTDSCEIYAYRPSGENATPCTTGLVVGTRASSLSDRVSTMLTLRSFLLVTMTIEPSGEGSTL